MGGMLRRRGRRRQQQWVALRTLLRSPASRNVLDVCLRALQRPGPGLHQRERGAPTAQLSDLSLGPLPKFLELGPADEPEQPRLQGHAELHGKAQVWMSRGKRADLRPDLRIQTSLPQKFELPPPGIQVTPGRDERLSEKRDEPFGSRGGRVEVPRSGSSRITQPPGATRRR
jgi:hypothetical protein